jgi:phosphate transporter
MSNIPPFTASTQNTLQDLLTRVTELYARCVMNGDGEGAEKALRLHQREHVAWERDTVWRTMLTQARGSGPDTDGGAIVEGTPRMVYHEEEKPLVGVPTPLGRFNITKRKVSLLAAVVTGTVLLNLHVVDGIEASRCFAILMFCTILWATEVSFPRPMGYCPSLTSTRRPSHCSLHRCRYLCCWSFSESFDLQTASTPHCPPRKQPSTSICFHFSFEIDVHSRYVFSQMFSPTIMLLIGGFTIASALSKTAIDRLLITRVLSLAGTKPRTVLLAFMGVGCFASMWIRFVQLSSFRRQVPNLAQ